MYRIISNRTPFVLVWLAITVGLYLNFNYIRTWSNWLLVSFAVFATGVVAFIYMYARNNGLLPRNIRVVSISKGLFIVVCWLLLASVSSVIYLNFGIENNHIGVASIFANTARILLVYIFFSVLWLLQGRFLLRISGLSIRDGLGHSLFSVVLGQVFTILFWYALSLVGLVSRWGLLMYIVATIFFARHELKSVLNFALRRLSFSFSLSLGTTQVVRTLLILALLVYCGAAFISNAGFEPYDGDSTRTYYNIPKLMAQEGAVVDFPYDELNNAPLASSYLYMPLVLFNPQYLNFINIALLLLVVGSVFYAARRYVSESAALFACFLLLSVDVVPFLTVTVKSDLLLAFVLLWASLMALRNTENNNIRALIFAGFLLGVSFAVKYNALYLFAGFVSLAVFEGVRMRSFRHTARSVAIFTLFFLIGFSPWGVYNYVAHGSVTYPFTLRGAIASHSAQPELLEQFTQELTRATHRFSKSEPFLINIFNIGVNNTTYPNNKIGPFFLGLLPLFFLLRSTVFTRRALAVIIPTLVVWYISSVSQVWYVLFCLPLLCIVIAFYWAHIKSFEKKGITLVLTVFVLFNIPLGNIERLRGGFSQNAQAYMVGAHLESIEMVLNESIAPQLPRYLLFSFGHLRLSLIRNNHRHIIGNEFMKAWIDLVDNDVDVILTRMREQGITHVYFDTELMTKYEPVICSAGPCPATQYLIRQMRLTLERLHVVKETDDWVLYSL